MSRWGLAGPALAGWSASGMQRGLEVAEAGAPAGHGVSVGRNYTENSSPSAVSSADRQPLTAPLSLVSLAVLGPF